jgi:iron uptake system component EfeO
LSRRLLIVAAVLPIALIACSDDSGSSAKDSGSGGDKKVQTIEITLSDSGCEPRSIPAQAGPTTFKVTNDGSAAVTEFEVLQNGRILGEVENVIPGSDRDFSLNLVAGKYDTKCPGGSAFEAGTVEVAEAASGAAANEDARKAAVKTYLNYVTAEADKLVTAVGPFAAAVKAGDTATAKNQFAAARAHYESIEPIAESFGDLDPAIDAREGDVADNEWGGFHRIEKALFADNNLTGMSTVADKLVADIAKLRAQIATIELEPSQIANGAVELLNEMSTSKITGEEDRYSGTDLSDFAANLAGSKAAFEAVSPLLDRDRALADQISTRFNDVRTALDQHRGTDPAGNGYVLYKTLTPEQTRSVSTTLDTLAEPLSRVAAEVL